MKKIISAAFFVSLVIAARAQNPVQWNYGAKKIADKTYEIRLTATIDNSWHIYSQTTPEGGPVPTEIKLNKNPLVVAEGNFKEVGKLEEKFEEVFEIDVKYFSGKVDFVQVVKVKGNAKTNLSGTIEYMVCTDEKCLPPKTIQFNVSLAQQ